MAGGGARSGFRAGAGAAQKESEGASAGRGVTGQATGYRLGQNPVLQRQYYNPIYARTLGSIRSGDQKGVHTRLIVTVPTPGRAFRMRSASPMISGPLGHPGEVSDMSTSTSLPIRRTS